MNAWLLLTFDDLWNAEISRIYLAFTRTLAEFASAQEGVTSWPACLARSLLAVLSYGGDTLDEATGFRLRLQLLNQLTDTLSTLWTRIKQSGKGVRTIRIAVNGIFRNVYSRVSQGKHSLTRDLCQLREVVLLPSFFAAFYAPSKRSRWSLVSTRAART